MRVTRERIRDPRATWREQSPFSSLWSSDGKAVAWVFLLACIAYGGALAGGFIYDDYHTVVGNQALRDPDNLPRYFWDVSLFSQLGHRMYRPVLLVTYALDHLAWGLDPMRWKATNVLLHGIVGVLLFRVARQRGAGRMACFFGSAVFVAHPLASQAVNAVSSRSDTLVLLGVLLSLWSYGNVRVATGRFGLLVAWLGIGFGAVIACGAKPTAIVLPGVLVMDDLLQGCRGQRGWRRAIHGIRGASIRRFAVRMLPAAAVVAGYLVVRQQLLGMATAKLPKLTDGHDPLRGGGRDLLTQLCSMANALPESLGKMLWPHELTLQPAFPIVRTVLHDGVLLGGFGLLALFWALARQARVRPAIGLGLTLAAATSLPWIVLPLNVPISEHRLYGTLAGACLCLAGMPWARWLVRLRRASRLITPNLRALASAVVCFALLSLAVRSNLRSLDYRDEGAMWRAAAVKQSTSHQALWGVAMCSIRDGRPREALGWMERAVACYPKLSDTRITLVDLHLQLVGSSGQPFAALRQAEQLVAEGPLDPYRHLLLAQSQIAVGDLVEDAVWYARAERTALGILDVAKTPKGMIYIVASIARDKAGDPEGALKLLDTSIARGLDHETVHGARGEQLLRMGRRREAQRELQHLLGTAPGGVHAQRLAHQLGLAAPPR